ncbi:penicillin-binding protein 2, partial [Candidatus Dependentiae bacterium]|nr:penicillin-binding protein 2 [Candidatus Dependentiae bacterium]
MFLMMRPGHKIRISMILGVCTLIYTLVIVRLLWVQVVQQDFFCNLATQQYLIGGEGVTQRGDILDRYGHQLVVNKELPSAFILPHVNGQTDILNDFLKEYYPAVLARIERNPRRHFFWLERRLTPEREHWLKQQKVPAIQFAQESVRYYPYPELAHVLGFTDIDNKGIAGLELAFDKELRGVPPLYNMAKDARSKRFYFEKITKKEGTPSQSVQLTIDHKLQFLLYQDLADTVKAFKAKQGAVIVLDPFSGDVLSMVSYPAFNANEVTQVDLSVTKNVAVTECYEVGSVMKIFAALAGLAEQVVNFDEEVDCEGKITYIQGLRVENWKSLGVMSFCEAVKNSSNVVLAKIGLLLKDRLYEHLVRAGFGRKTLLGFPGERSGFVNQPQKWSRFSPMVMTFGYEVTVTLLQIARAIAIIANGGYYVEPTLIKTAHEKPSQTTKQLYASKNLEEITSILEKVGERYPIKGFKLKGKTGTARMVVDGHYSTKQHIYTFAGFVEKDDYRRVVV